jgi:hypothetical protein
MVNFGDTNLVVFMKKSVKNPVRSQAEGRPIFEDVDFIRLAPPGEKLNIIERPVQEADKYRYAMQWHKYLNNQTQVPEGTPIDLLFPQHPSVADSLRAQGVHTVEQCAGLSAHAMDSIGMGAQDYVNKAKAYLDNAAKGVNFHMMQKQLDEQKSQNRVLEQKLQMALTQINTLKQKIENPAAASLNPPYMPNFDVQAERINSNHATKELAQRTRKNTVADDDDKKEDF